MSATLLVGAAVSLGLLATHAWWLLLPASLVVLSRVAYRSAAAAAAGYSVLINAAVDLHRFDLLRALHLGLPANLDAERQLWGVLSAFLMGSPGTLPPYVHPPSD